MMEKRKTDFVVGAYIIHKGKVLLIHQVKLDMWLPVGGHIEKDEVPDDALLREVKEEVCLDVELVTLPNDRIGGEVTRYLAVPFHANIHNVGNHDHCCFNYLCVPTNPAALKINNEIYEARWFSREDLKQDIITPDVRIIALKALEAFKTYQ